GGARAPISAPLTWSFGVVGGEDSCLSRKVIVWFQEGLECSKHYPFLICDWPPQPRHSQTAAIFKIWFVRGRGALSGPTSSTRRSGSPHSITSSARPSSVSGMVRPSALAVLRLTISSTFVAC